MFLATARQAEILRYTKLRMLYAPFLATTSAPAGWVVASHTFEAPSVFSNPARTCHHVGPADKLKPRGETSLSLKVYVLSGGAEDAWRIGGEKSRKKEAMRASCRARG